MIIQTQDSRVASGGLSLGNLPMRKMLTSALPFIAVALPGTAYAQQATNTATVTAPSGALESNTANNSATDTDAVFQALVANDDTATGAFGFAGATDVVSVLGNDTLASAAATTSNVTIAVASGSSVPTGLTFDTLDGTVDVAAGTAAGTYAFDYEICEAAQPTNCATGTVSVTVSAPAIVATADSAVNVDGVAGATDVVFVLDGDTIGGVAATTTNVVISVASGSSVPAGLTFDTTDGGVSVDPNTPAGTYSFDYTICDAVNPTNCATETVTVTVAAPTLVADADTVTGVDSLAGGTNVVNVLDGDTLGGVQVTPSDVVLTVASGSSVPTGLTFDTSTGNVSVDPNTPAGTYTFDYTVCDALNPSNCATNTVSVTIDAPVILADADTVAGVSGTAGGTAVVNVLDGDTIGGAAATTANVVLSVASGSSVPAGLTFNTADGTVDVAPGTAAGTYTFDYTICDAVNPTNCSTNTVSVTVDAAVISAVADNSADVNGAVGGTDVLNVLDNDTLDGVAASTATVTLSVASGSSVPAGLTFDITDGSVDVAAGTSAGVYTFDYTICENVNPANCSTSTVTVNVTAPAILADDDIVAGLNGVTGGSDVLNVLDGDTLNGVQTDITEVSIAIVSPATGAGNVPFIDITTGQVQVPANTPADVYIITYEIEDRNNPGNVAQATATVTVAPSVDLSITKTNNQDTVSSGQTVTYTLVVSNAGPDAAVGAVVTDVPGAGLTCPAGNTVTLTGDGVPAGSFTMADLTSTGITLGSLSAGQSTTITYTCTVN